ncbi:hypothetical protein XENTR_v10012406 [Xenopus tropicalis]|uniref:Protein-associating with the carboxyl-terminal domain of ezrin isoform X2 n=1 Tax=Xenopus tropicalis TaxID=8364 RepID=A0A8J0T3T5_XENTR|nr:protein-associating with the carboxyl-terminal domain of ezrin isoform X2 [Xenopus tropicalis]KAE8611313.1 hypothetical protein XENTR_v10012406 [Xenopus tropicalis]|eukprot:XP_017949135.1 PREDICTED: protein-associating with the carboxyl-terminal domain of ezrin isoform X2 [Xenopus tropicalis]
MGSENSSLRGFTLQDPPWTQPSGLTIYPALLAEGRPASVFVYQPENQDKVDKAAKHLKTLRHPCLLRFLSCAVEEDGIYLVTERVQPLEMLLEKLSTDEICAGIYDILQALVFLHDRGKVSHNNVCLSSVFVSEDGHWKLGGMEMVCNLTEVSPESAEFGIIPMALSHARDAFSFGRLIESLLAHVSDQNEPLSNFKSTVKNSLLNPEPELRPALSTLLSHDFFRNDFLEVVNFLESLTVKTEEEKNEFFKFLLDRVSSLSEELISSRLVPLLLNQLVFAEPVAVKSFLPHLLRPKRDIMGRTREDCLLSPALFQSRVIPVLMKMFEVHEEHVRVVLLTHIDAYGELFTLKELKDIILPQVLLGLRDTSDMLVAVTLRGLAALVCLLGPETVVGGGRVKIFKSTTPGFTKNADITPEGSPVHSIYKQQMLLNQENVLAKGALSGIKPATPSSLFHQHRTNPSSKFTSDSCSSLNGITDLKKPKVTSHTIVTKPPEDWVDWNEPEPLQGTEQPVREKVQPAEEIRIHVLPQDSEPWDDFGSSDDISEPAAAEGPVPAQQDVGEGTNSTAHFTSSLSLDSNSVAPVTNAPNQTKGTNKLVLTHPKAPHEKKSALGFGLGEEFTITVKSTSRDPELDLFADMAPDIKVSSSVYNVPAAGTNGILAHYGEIKTEVPDAKGSSQTTAFSSKFAAAAVTEAEGEGWGEENDFSWEEDANTW